MTLLLGTAAPIAFVVAVLGIGMYIMRRIGLYEPGNAERPGDTRAKSSRHCIGNEAGDGGGVDDRGGGGDGSDD